MPNDILYHIKLQKMKKITFIKNKISDAANFMIEYEMMDENALISLALLIVSIPIMIAIL
jgi:hypothetical protein